MLINAVIIRVIAANRPCFSGGWRDDLMVEKVCIGVLTTLLILAAVGWCLLTLKFIWLVVTSG